MLHGGSRLKSRFRTPEQYRKPSVEFEAILFDGMNEAECRSIVPAGRVLERGFWYFKLDGILHQASDEAMYSFCLPAEAYR